MSDPQTDGERTESIENEAKGDREEPTPSDEEEDYEGYFLEPVGNNADIAARIAEANKKLKEEEDEDEDRPRKVQFSEELVNFLPNYYSDDDYTESPRNSVISEEDLEVKLPQDETNEESLTESTDDGKITEEITEIVEEINEEIIADSQELICDEGSNKLLLVLLPKEQNSSCESIIGEEIPEEKDIQRENKETKPENTRTKIPRPKSAKKSCEMSQISPSLSYSSNMERRSWRTGRYSLPRSKSKGQENEKKNDMVGETRVEIKRRTVKKINIGELNSEMESQSLKRCCESRPKSSQDGRRWLGAHRPKTAPMRRTCCVIKTELPRYNGLRSEYGLSAEQLQERKEKTMEIKQQRKQEKLKERQEELRRRNENEETFRKWLLNKTKKSHSKKTGKLTDTLTRSDVFIQAHASYAANRNVPYSVDYSLTKKITYKKRETWEKKNNAIILDKLLDKVSPHFKRSFNIYLGVRPQ